jgi:hypothetical protein
VFGQERKASTYLTANLHAGELRAADAAETGRL